MAPLKQTKEQEHMKLLAAYCILNGDYDKVATYMGISKNAVQIRYAKVIKDEKAKIAAAGLLTQGLAASITLKKRGATNVGGQGAQKRVKKQEVDDEDSSDHGQPRQGGSKIVKDEQDDSED